MRFVITSVDGYQGYSMADFGASTYYTTRYAKSLAMRRHREGVLAMRSERGIPHPSMCLCVRDIRATMRARRRPYAYSKGKARRSDTG